jgi:phenylalanyl-tRNA synthetase beta subunit
MQYAIKKINKDKIEVTIPPFRCDVMHTVDVADDLAEVMVFNNINFTTKYIYNWWTYKRIISSK